MYTTRRTALIVLMLFFPPLETQAEEVRYVYSLSSIAPEAGERDLTYQIIMARSRGMEPSGRENLPGRPFGPDAVEHWAGIQYGLTDSLTVSVQSIFTAQPDRSMEYGSFRVGTRYRMKSPAGLPVDAAFAGGYLRETDCTSVIQGAAAISRDWGPVNLTGNLQMEKALAPWRDPADVILTAGSSYRMAEWVSAGVEYAGQDLESAWEKNEAEGGARHLVGPTLVFRGGRNNVQVAVSPSVALTPLGAGYLLRGALSYSF